MPSSKSFKADVYLKWTWRIKFIEVNNVGI